MDVQIVGGAGRAPFSNGSARPRLDDVQPRDVHIVGGGFAGVVTALTLQRQVPGARITVHEREAAAHTTLCGEGISADTLRLFAACSGFDSSPYIAETFDEVSWFFPGGNGRRKEVRVHQRGHTMARESWIPAMAGEVVRRGGRYQTNSKISPDDVRAMAAASSDALVVGADGPGSSTRKVVGGHHETMLGIQYRVAREGRVPSRLEFYTDKRYSPEYSWVFPRGDIMNVGLLATGDGDDWERLDRFMKDVEVTGKIVKREAYPIGFFGDKVQEKNVVLVGDAAGLTNPITKGGMAAVVHTAWVLADAARTGRIHEYGARIAAHPLSERTFRPALASLRRWTNDEFARLTRYAPDIIQVTPGVSTERRYVGTMLRTFAANAGKVRELMTVAKAMGVSREYSW